MAMACLELSCASCSTGGYIGSHGLILMVTHTSHTLHSHTTHAHIMHHLHGHSHTTHSLKRSHTTHTNATKRILQTALWEAARTHLLTPTYALTRALAHSHTHLVLLHSFTPIRFCILYEKIIFTCGVIRSFNFLKEPLRNKVYILFSRVT